MLKLYIANKNYSSWSLRPWVLMKELAIPFEESLQPFSQDSNWEAFRVFSQTGLVPSLKDGATEVWDSLAIAEYLAEENPRVWPTDKQARTWARCAAAEMHSGFPTIREQCSMNCAIRVRLNPICPALKKDIDRIKELWAQGLNLFGGPFLAGKNFTAVDAFFAPVVFRIRTYDLEIGQVAKQYVEHILSLRSMREWDEAALQEPWIEAGHEEDCLKYGTLIEDFRQTKAS